MLQPGVTIYDLPRVADAATELAGAFHEAEVATGPIAGAYTNKGYTTEQLIEYLQGKIGGNGGVAVVTITAIALPVTTPGQTEFQTYGATSTDDFRIEFFEGSGLTYAPPATTPATPTPTKTQLAAPTNLQQTGSTTSSVTMGWSAVPNATGYRLLRNGGTTLMPGTATSYTDTRLAAGSSLTYQVQALYGGTGNYSDSAYSASAPASTQQAAPAQTAANSTDANGNPPQNDTSTYQEPYSTSY